MQKQYQVLNVWQNWAVRKWLDIYYTWGEIRNVHKIPVRGLQGITPLRTILACMGELLSVYLKAVGSVGEELRTACIDSVLWNLCRIFEFQISWEFIDKLLGIFSFSSRFLCHQDDGSHLWRHISHLRCYVEPGKLSFVGYVAPRFLHYITERLLFSAVWRRTDHRITSCSE